MAGRNVIFYPPDVITDGIRVAVHRAGGAPRRLQLVHMNGMYTT